MVANTDPIAEIKRLYYSTTRTTVERDLARAIELLKTLETEEARERVAVYMDGLSQMRSEWEVRTAVVSKGTKPHASRTPGENHGPRRTR